VRQSDALLRDALDAGFNFRRLDDGAVGIALDETVTRDDLRALARILGADLGNAFGVAAESRSSVFLRQTVSTDTNPSTRCCGI